jgi:O-antigen ligase
VPPTHARLQKRSRRVPTIGRFARPSAVILAFATFAAFVALTGGSSRPHIGWALVLRPASVLCIVAMLLAGPVNWRSVGPVSALLALFAATIAIQLVPLPPALWYGLDGRESYDAVARLLGGTKLWHPLSVSPDRTWNSLVALLTPLGTIIGFAALDDRQRRLLLWPVLGIVVFSMVLGVLQIASGTSSPLYWYKVSGRGQLIGLLANRNHQAALLALALPLLRAWSLFPVARRRSSRTRVMVGLAVGAATVLYLLVLGSRAGLALLLVGLISAFLVKPSIGTTRVSTRKRWIIAGGLVSGIAAILIIALSTDRAVAIGRLVDDDLSTEGRLAALPTLMQIIGKTWLLGTGFGSFVPVYATYEPDALLKTSYFNNAHNDLIELVITGGMPALLVFLGFFVWWVRASWRTISTSAPPPWRALQRASAFGILIVLLASLTDYPLRAPLIAAVFTILCCWLAHTPDTGTSRIHD